MGTGNILLNLTCEADNYIGNDKQKLVPKLYNELVKYTYDLESIENVLNKFNRFSHKDDYYTFRDYWNEKYLNDEFNKDFVVETVLLLKMCSNSMVRFNLKGVFNQGFRGLGKSKEFFSESMKNTITDTLNELSKRIKDRNIVFTTDDFVNFRDSGEEDLLILDPPYILRQDMYNKDFTKEIDNKVLDLISTTKNDFIYFNYLQRGEEKHEALSSIIKKNNFNVITVNKKASSGQGRSVGAREVEEVLITNIYN